MNQYIQSKSCISYCCSAYKIQLLSFHSKLVKHAWHYKATNKERSDSLGGNDRLLYDFLITLWWHTFRIRPSCKETRHCCNYKPEHTPSLLTLNAIQKRENACCYVTEYRHQVWHQGQGQYSDRKSAPCQPYGIRQCCVSTRHTTSDVQMCTCSLLKFLTGPPTISDTVHHL